MREHHVKWPLLHLQKISITFDSQLSRYGPLTNAEEIQRCGNKIDTLVNHPW